MGTLGIIAEYNPFHNGHLFQLTQAKRLTGCEFSIAVMSGNFVQRGAPAVVDKYLRTEMALAAGIDMVLELPVHCATSSAGYFAESAVRVLDSSGIVDFLCFGSESGDLEFLGRTADALQNESESYRTRLKSALKSGCSYPSARQFALEDTDAPVSPNDILAVEYLKALKKIKSAIIPQTVKRSGAGYHQTEITGEIASATAVRNSLAAGDWDSVRIAVPQTTYDTLRKCFAEGNFVPGLDMYSDVFQYLLKTFGRIDEIMDVSEGLDNRFRACGANLYRFSEILDAVKTKRYTYTRISRAALHILLGLRKSDIRAPEYLRVLGVRKSSSHLIGGLAKNARLPVVTLLRQAMEELSPSAADMLCKEIASTDVYYLGLQNKKPHPNYSEYGKDFIIV